MTTAIGATPSVLEGVAQQLGRDRDDLDELARRATWALDDLRHVSHEPSIVLDVPPEDGRIAGAAWSVGGIGSDVASVAAALRAADSWDRLRRRGSLWWGTGVAGIHAADELATIRLHDLPGLGRLPAIEVRAAGSHLWALVRIIDETRRDRVGQLRDRAVQAGRARIGTAAGATSVAHAGRRGASAIGRAADVLASPTARQVVRALGRATAVVGIGADLVDAVDRGTDGDGWGAARSVLSAAGGAALFSPTPLAVAGAAVVAGVYVYENREAIADTARTAWRAADRAADRAVDEVRRRRDAVRDAARDVAAAAEDVGDAAGAVVDAVAGLGEATGDMLEGARAVVDGLF